MTSPGIGSSASIDDVLSALDIEIRRQSRFEMGPGESFALEANHVSIVYAVDGEAFIDFDACFSLSGKNTALPPALSRGDAFLAFDAGPMRVSAPTGASIMLSSLDLAESSSHLTALLPRAALIGGFAELEPAAAALSLHLGPEIRSPFEIGEHCPDREGDRTVCRMMARTVLLSALRAWWRRGCAPEGWPSLSKDPFLDRVAAAVVEDPGRDWSLESLAAFGAMSRSVFAERFREAFGSSPASYVAEVRMRAAKDLLARGRGVSEVSRELGYRSDEGFSRAFRRHTGVTPSAWRSMRAGELARTGG